MNKRALNLLFFIYMSYGMQKELPLNVVSEPGQSLYTRTEQVFYKKLCRKSDPFLKNGLAATLHYSIISGINLPTSGTIYGLWEEFGYRDSDALKLLVAKTILEMKENKNDDFKIVATVFGYQSTKDSIIFEELGFDSTGTRERFLICEPKKIEDIKAWVEITEAEYNKD